MRYLILSFISCLFASNVFGNDLCNDFEWIANLTKNEVLELINQEVDFEQKCSGAYTPLELIITHNYDMEVYSVLVEHFPHTAKLNSSRNCRFFLKNNLGHNLSQIGFPVILWLHPDIPEKYIESFYAAAQVWEDRFNIDFFNFRRLEDESPSLFHLLMSRFLFNEPVKPLGNGRSVIYWDVNWDDDDRKLDSILARFFPRNLGYWIIESDIHINAKHYRYYTNVDMANDKVEEGSYHLESTIIHELGHVLGLDDNDNIASVMGPVRIREQIEEFDYRNIMCEYSSIIGL